MEVCVMCLAVPVQVARIQGSTGWVRTAAGEVRVDLTLVPQVRVGDWVLVHAGFALQVLDEEEARRSLEEWRRAVEHL